jgi:hypothetical protein
MEALLHPDQPDISSSLTGVRDANLMRSVNRNLRERSETRSDDEPIPFFCECANPACYSPIWMSAAAFDAKVTDQPGWLLHDGHEPSALWHRREPLPARTSLRPRPSNDAARTSPDGVPGSPRHLRLVFGGRLTRDPSRNHAEVAHSQ